MSVSPRISFVLWPLSAAVLILASVWSGPSRAATLDAQQVALQLGAPASLTGALHIVWGDPHPDATSAGTILHLLALPDGRMMPLQMAGLEHEALPLFNKPVVVRGRMASRSVAAGGQSAQREELVVVESIELDSAAPQPSQGFDAVVTGTRKVIYLLVRFAGDTVPHPPSWYLTFNNPDTPPSGELFPTTINGFYKKTSWDQFSWLADVGGVGGVGAPGGWLTLPGAKSDYANCGWSSVCASLSLLSNDAITLGKAAGINFTVYDNINFVLSNDLDCCAWGGGWSFDGKSYGATWEPPWGQEADTYSHEFGHSIGLPHSGWVYYAYDSPWDTMSGHTHETSQACGSYNSANAGGVRTINCATPGGGFISAHKQSLGWIPGANIITTDTTSTVNTLLEGLALPLSGAVKMIKICLPGFSCDSAVSTARYFTVEARIKSLGPPSQYDNGIAGDGILIHEVRRDRPGIGGTCFFNSSSGWAVPIDANPGDYNSTLCNTSGFPAPAALFDAQFVPGQTYTNAQYAFKVVVGNRVGSTFGVTVMADGTTKAEMTSPAPGSTLGGSSATFNWSTGTGALQYWLYVGTTGVGSYNLLSRDMGLTQTRVVNGIPIDGSTIYVRLWTRFSTGWESHDYTYTAAAPGVKAVITSPAPGSTMFGTAVTFNWSTGTSALQYWIYVGTTGVGTHNILSADMGLTRTRLVTGLPITGSTIYVRLWTLFSTGWESNDYAYTACLCDLRSTITSPTPGSTLAGSSVTFVWTAGTGVLQYWLYVGTTGVGSDDILSADMGLARTRLVTGIPTDGGTIYVRLWTRYSTGWQYTDYTYTAAAVQDIRIAPTSLAFVPATVKTIYVEVDWMDDGGHSHKPSQAVIDAIVATFAREGFTVVLDVSNVIPAQTVLPILGSPSSSPAVIALKDAYFDHKTDNRYFYSLWVHNYSYNGSSTTSSGIADLPGNTHLVSLGSFSGSTGTFSNQVGTFIHEFGHNLGQKHGGVDHDNYKPNYLSVMNYHYQLNGVGTTLQAKGWVNTSTGFNNFGYSHGQASSLNEASLDENVGIGFANAIDWNCSSTFTTGLSKDLQASNPCSAGGAISVLTDYDNWAQIDSFVNAGAIPPAATGDSSVMCITPAEDAELAAAIAAMRARGLLPSETEVMEETSGGVGTEPQAAAARTFTVYNDGGATLNVTGITASVSAPWISWEPETFSVAPGGSQVVYVYANFDTAPGGTTTRRLLVASNDPDENPYPGGVDVTVTGTTVIVKAVMTSPAPGSTLGGSSATFNWSTGTGALKYWLYVGTTGVGTYNILSRDMGLVRTRVVNGLPFNGSTIYVRLWTLFSAGWQYTDYTYSAATAGDKAVMTSPAPGSTLTSSTQTFTWSTGTAALQYWIYVGTTGVGSHDVFSKDMGLSLTRWVSGLPTAGGTIYVRVWTRFASGWQWNDYTYTSCSGCI